ncbi:MAG TPA: acyltransferase [Actinomycetales bacterium]|nr:acyltransferase [Actinomycetales bacterium]
MAATPRSVARASEHAWIQGGTQEARGTGGAHAPRDRYVDILRVGSLLVVVLGHWLMGGVDGEGRVTNALVEVPWLQPLTWVLQVMPLFFLVGGVAHSYALESLHRKGGTTRGRYAAFVRTRAGRLLRPTAAFLGVWLVLGLAARSMGLDDVPLVATALHLVTQLLWFVGVYLGVAALAPAMHAAHRRWGATVVVALVLAAATVDVARFAGGFGALATVNFALVWLDLHQLGFCWRDGLLGRRVATTLAVGGLAGLLLIVSWGPYPVSMVGLPGEAVSNMAPPTIALLAQGIALVGAAVLLRVPVTRVLAGPRAWRAVMVAGSLAMTTFLWHLTALFVAVLTMRLAGVEQPAAGTGAWWATRPLWLGALVLLSLPLVLAFRRVDAPRPAPVGTLAETRRLPDLLAATGSALTVLGVLMISVCGVDVLGGGARRFVVADVTPGVALAVLVSGCGLLAAARPVRR